MSYCTAKISDNSVSVKCAMREPTVPSLKSRAISSLVSSASLASSQMRSRCGSHSARNNFGPCGSNSAKVSESVPVLWPGQLSDGLPWRFF